MSILISNMKVTKIVQKHFLCTFWGFLVTIICDIKIDISMCEPHYVNLFFLWTSSIVHVFDFLTFDIFLTTWHLFDNLTSFFDIWTHGQMGIMVNTEDRDGAPWGMGHMVNVIMCLIMCNFLNTAWIFIKIVMHIDINVFYLNILWFSTMAFSKYKNWWIWNSDWFQHWFHEPVPMSSYGTCPISLLSVGLSLVFFYWR